MSKTIDERVVSMQFDNKHFESNVKTTMSTLDKLKEKLHLDGASKGLENINTATRKINMNPLAQGIETVRLKFSALEIMGITALANITNSAINAGKRIASALTIDPIKTGLQEYETQINAVQTIMANVESKGYSLDDVNASLAELNEYADKTIYNFTEMTRNIGTFTAAGVDLKAATSNIQGLANAAAMAGANSQQASTAMYQMSQAMSSGTVRLQDWMSLENNSMAGVAMQDALKETARVHGIAIDSMIEKYGSFRYTLQEGWLTADLFSETLDKFTMTTEGLTEAEIEANRERWRSIGYTEEQIDKIFELGTTATNAATKVKTFSQMWDVLKETAQSGWSKTWQLIFGDFEEAKNLFTPLTEFLSNIINGISKARNALLEGALGSPLGKLAEKITNVTDSVKSAVETVQDYSAVVDKILNGEFGTGQARWDKLTEAGYDWAHAQNLVNEKLGDSTRHATEYKEAQSELTEVQSVNIDQLAEMSDAQLKSLGYTEEQIEAIQILSKHAKKAGIPLSEFINNIDQVDGRTLLLESLKNIGLSIVKVFTAMKDAWVEIFPPMTAMELYDIIANFNEFSKGLVMTDDTVSKLKRTLKGVFAILDIITTITGGGLKIAIKAIVKLLGMADVDILSITASIGDAIVGFRDWIDETLDLTKVFEKMIPCLKTAAESVHNWIAGLKETDNIPKYIIQGLVNGLKNGIQNVISTVIELGKSILESIKKVLGIHSPSTEFFEIGTNIIQGLVNGLQNGASSVWETVKSIASKCVEFVKSIDFGALFAAALGIGALALVKKLDDILEMFAAPIAGIGEMFDGLGYMFKSIGKNFKAKALEHKSKALLNFAIAIGILVGAVFVLTKIKDDGLWEAIGALGALSAIILVLAAASNLLGKAGSFGKQALSIFAISGSLLILAFAMKQLSGIKGENVDDVLKLLTGMIIGMGVVLVAFGKLAKGDTAKQMNNVGKMMIKMSVALLIMVGVIKLASKLRSSEIERGLGVVIAVELLFAAVVAVSKFAGEHASKAGTMLLKMSAAMLIMVGVIKIASTLSNAEVERGIGIITAVELLFGAIVFVSALAGKNSSKAGTMMLKMAGAMAIIAISVKLLAGLSNTDVERGIEVVSAVGLIFAGIIAMSLLTGKNASKAGTMLLLMSGALLILTGAMYIISKMDPSGLYRSLGVVTVLELLFGGLIVVSRFAGDCKGTLIVMLAGIAILVAAVAALSLIEPTKLAGSTAAISILMGVFSFLVSSTGKLGNVNSITKPLLTLLGVVAVLALVIAAMSTLNPMSALGSATSLSVLLIALSASMKILSTITYISNDTIKQMYALSGIVAILAVILGVMSGLNVEASIPTAVSLGVLLNAMAAAMIILDQVSYVSPSSLIGLAAMGLIVAEIAVILGVMSGLNVEPSLETAAALSLLLLTMSGVLVVVEAAGLLAPAATAGILALIEIVSILGAFMVGIGALVYAVPELETFLDIGIPVLEKIGHALGSFFGNMIGGFAGGILSVIADAGTVLSLFMINATGFFEGAKNITEESIAGVKSLAEMILILTAADLLQSIASCITGESSMIEFANQLVPFGLAMVSFSDTIKGKIDESSLTAAATAGKMLAEMAATIPKTNGLIQFFTGEHDMLTFSSQIKAFGEAIVGFSDKVSKGTINSSAVEAAANAGKMLAEMAATIPATGGLFQFFTGEHDMLTFSSQLKVFGIAIIGFSNEISKGTINSDAIEAAANAGKMLAEMASTIPASNGLFQFFAGEHDMLTFSSQLKVFGFAIASFSEEVNKANIKADTVEAAANAGKMIAEMAATIPASGGIFQAFSGEHDMGKFSEQLVKFGEAIVGFSDKVSGGKLNPSAVESAANAGKMLAEMAAVIPKDGGIFDIFTADRDMGKFGEQLVDFGDAIDDFSDAVDGINPLATAAAVTVAKNLTEVANALPKEGIDIGSFFEDEANLGALARAFKEFSDESVGIQPYIVENAVSAGKKVFELAKAVPGEGGLKNIFSGDKSSIDIFGQQLVSFGVSIKDFSTQVSGIDSSSVSSAVTVGQQMIELSKNIPSDGGIKGIISGELNMTTFGQQLVNFGVAIKRFANSVSDVDSGNVSSAISSSYQVIELVKNLPASGGSIALLASGSGSNSFGSQLVSLGDSIKTFVTKAGGVDAGSVVKVVNKFKNAMDQLQTAGNNASRDIKNMFVRMKKTSESSINDLVSLFTSSGSKISKSLTVMLQSSAKAIDSNKKTFGDVGKSLITEFINGIQSMKSSVMDAVTTINTTATSAIGSNSTYNAFYNAGYDVVNGFANGINDNTGVSITKAQAMAASALNAAKSVLGIHSPSTEFYNAGYYAVTGFANGISDNMFNAEAKAKAMAISALNAAKTALSIHSPSKEFYNVGDFAGQGFINAFSDYESISYKAGSSIGNYAKQGLTDAIAKVSDIVENKIDAQPTIRPVLDLTDITTGTRAISNMFDMSPSVGVLSNVNSISSMMNRNQNGNNSDVVSAIKELKDTIGQPTGDIYNVNGITYDDGSNITEAVKSLVRAAKVERRT